MTQRDKDALMDLMIEECRAVVDVYTISTHLKFRVYSELLAGTVRLMSVRGEKGDVLLVVDQLRDELKEIVEGFYGDR